MKFKPKITLLMLFFALQNIFAQSKSQIVSSKIETSSNIDRQIQSFFDSTKISKETMQIVREMAKYTMLRSKGIGASSRPSEEYKVFEKLQKIATSEELQLLLKHPQANVKGYAFWGIAKNYNIPLFPIIQQHLQDTTQIMTQFGCIAGSYMLGDLFIELASSAKSKLSDREKNILDSLSLYTQSSLHYVNQAIHRAGENHKFYEKVKEYAIAKNPIAIVALAKFQQEIDIPTILNYKDTIKYGYFFNYQAISYFPHTNFLPFLEKQLRESFIAQETTHQWKTLYEAIASYKNEQAKSLLNLVFKEAINEEIKDRNYLYLCAALTKYHSPLYNDLLFEVWDKANLIDKNIFDSLAITNPKKALILTKKSLENTDNYFKLTNPDLYQDDFGFGNSINIITKMLNFLTKHDKKSFRYFMEIGILKAESLNISTFLEQLNALKPKKQVQLLSERLEIEDNGHVYLEIARILLKLNQKRVIEQAIKKNKALTKGWAAKDLQLLLQ